jgi:hypothetical protein
MSDNSTSAGFPADDFFFDSVNLVASMTISAVAYSIMFTLWVICVYFLWQQMRTGSRERNRCAFFLGYISVMCVFGTMYTVTTVHATTISYVQHRDFPGGPEAYNNFVLFSAPVGIASNVSYILANWMADGLLVSPTRVCRGVWIEHSP